MNKRHLRKLTVSYGGVNAQVMSVFPPGTWDNLPYSFVFFNYERQVTGLFPISSCKDIFQKASSSVLLQLARGMVHVKQHFVPEEIVRMGLKFSSGTKCSTQEQSILLFTFKSSITHFSETYNSKRINIISTADCKLIKR